MRDGAANVLDLPITNVVARGFVTAEDARYAEAVIGGSVAGMRWSVAGARVRISRHSRPAAIAVTQVNLAVAGRLIRAQAAARTVTAAIDAAAARLRHVLDVASRHLAAEEVGRVAFLESDWPLAPSPLPPVPGLPGCADGDSRLVRSKTFPLAVQQVAAAALTMELRDYDLHLFTEEGTGRECVVFRKASGGYGLIRPAGVRHPIEAIPSAAPGGSMSSLRVPEAIVRLNRTPSHRFLFFVDAPTGRGRVVYRRYDGQLGLIIPS